MTTSPSDAPAVPEPGEARAWTVGPPIPLAVLHQVELALSDALDPTLEAALLRIRVRAARAALTAAMHEAALAHLTRATGATPDER